MNKITILLFADFLATSTQADVEIMTIDGFKISNLGAHGLMVSKRAENPKGVSLI